MDKYINLKSSSNMANLKLVHFVNDQKTGQFFSEPTSHETTPKNVMRVKLEPLDKGALNQKLSEMMSPPKQKDNQVNSNTSKKPIVFPQKNFLLSVYEDTNTPKEEHKSKKKSKFASNLNDTIEKSHHYQDSPTSAFSNTGKSQKSREASNFSEAMGEWTEEKKEESQEFRITNRKKPLNNGRISRSKPQAIRSLSTSVLKPDQIQSDGELTKKEQEHIFKDALSTLPYRHLIFSPKLDIEKFKKHLTMTYKGLLYAVNSLRSPSEKFIQSKQVALPEPTIKRSKTLVLDLDETLIHACSSKDFPDAVLTYLSSNGETNKQLPLKVRPYLKEFFQKLSPLYEIIVFTASAPNYAKAVVAHIDPERKYINTLLTRENCMETKNGFFIKDLRVIKNRELKDLIIVDNLVHSFGFQIENGVPILEYFDDKHDAELKYLIDYLICAYQFDDIREFNKDKFRLRELAAHKLEDLFLTISS